MNKELDKLWKCHTLQLLKNRHINPYVAMWKDVQNILLEKQEVVDKCIQYDFIFEKLKHMYTYMYIFKDLSLRTDLLFTFSFDSNLSESTFFIYKTEMITIKLTRELKYKIYLIWQAQCMLIFFPPFIPVGILK